MTPALFLDIGPWAAATAASLLVMSACLRGQAPRQLLRTLRQLPQDEAGAVQSLSLVLTLPIFVLLMLFMIQLTQLTIARIVVEYAAYAAARSAVVWIPADLGDHEAANRVGLSLNPLGEYLDDQGVRYERYRLEHPSRKLLKIQQAAAQALMPICPSRDAGGDPAAPGMAARSSLEKAYAIWDPASGANTRINPRLAHKLAYALAATAVEVEVRHKETEPPLVWHDIRPYREEFAPNEIGWQDQIVVTVRHHFALLPGPGRLLARRMPHPVTNEDPVADRIVPHTRGPASNRPGSGTTFTYPLTATVRLANEGEKSMLASIPRFPW